MFLRITNHGEAPIEAFTVLGVSTSKASEELIGEFGSGNKHGINVCLRHGINPTIYCGLKRVEFFTQPETMSGQVFNRVFCKVSGRKPERLSISAEYGEKDWDNLGMALREFVSNAIDANGGTVKRRVDGKLQQVTVDIVESIGGRKGKTIVALPLTPEVQKWYKSLPLWFLQFRDDAKERMAEKIIEKTRENQCLVYRKGVLIRAAKEGEPKSLFNYNLGEELNIDEARNLSDSSIRDNVANTVGVSYKALKRIFETIGQGNSYWEFNLPEWELRYKANCNKEIWQKAWRDVYGDSVIANGISPLSMMAVEKGFNVVCIPESNWYAAIQRAGIKTIFDVLDNVNDNGDVLRDPTFVDQEVLDRVWTWLELVDLTNGKEKPTLKLYERILEGGTQKHGYYKDGVVHIHIEDRANPITMLEEVVHHVTGAHDCTRDFQDFAFRLAAKIAESAGL
jgi:hypothetical protein